MPRESELGEALQIAAALPQIQKEQVERASRLLYRLPIAEVAMLADAIEKHYALGVSLRAALMKVRGEKVRVAEWQVDAEGRCQHKRYAVGSTDRANHGEIGDETWLEAWIA